jgi:CRP/FNR family cyclic AMP-dependent transcriptional regulator
MVALRQEEDCRVHIILNQKVLSLMPLDQVGWLADQPDDFRHWVATVARWRKYRAGQSIFLAGDLSDGLYGLAAGAVELTFPLIGDEPISIYRAEIGFWIGDSAELSNEPRLVTLSAASECRMLHIPNTAIKANLTEQPQHWQCYYKLSHRNIQTAIVLLAESLSLSVRARVCRRLLVLTETSAEVILTHDQLAKVLGLARTTVSEELTRLSANGAVKTGYGKLRVLDRSILQKHKDEQ